MISKKQLIITNALELFAQKGYVSTSIQEITERCGISKGAFYLSFKSKDELFLAIFDDAIAQFSLIVDQAVIENTQTNDKLYRYYYSIFKFLNNHRNFAKLFVTEQMNYASHWEAINKKIFDKVSLYDHQFSFTILALIEQIYGEQIEITKYDLMICIKAFIKTFGEFVMLQEEAADLDKLSKSLVDKTNALAIHATTHYFDKTSFELSKLCYDSELSLERIIEQIDIRIDESEHPIEQESLKVLRTQLSSTPPNQAIIQGMLHNLKAFDGSRQLLHMYQQLEYMAQYGKL